MCTTEYHELDRVAFSGVDVIALRIFCERGNRVHHILRVYLLLRVFLVI